MFFDLIKDRVLLSLVVRKNVGLKSKGTHYVGMCPFHSEKTPSFTVNDNKKFFYCFGCHAHGDVISFTSKIRGLSYKDAAIALANEHNISLPRQTQEQRAAATELEQMHDLLDLALDFFRKSITHDAMQYLKKRGITNALIDAFEIGYCASGLINFLQDKKVPLFMMEKVGLVSRRYGGASEIFKNRIVFPIRDIYSKIRGFGGRAMSSESMPKYLNSPETLLFKKGELLYAHNIALRSMHKNNYVVLVEGYIDVIKMHAAGITNAVAASGTAITIAQLEALWSSVSEIVICMDGDDAGRNATKRIVDVALPYLRSNKLLSVISLPLGHDPDTIISQNESYMAKLLENRCDLSVFIWEIESSNLGAISAEKLAALDHRVDAYVNQMQDKNLQYNYRRFFQQQKWLLRKKKDHVSYSVDLPNSTPLDSIRSNMLSLIKTHPELLDRDEVVDFLTYADIFDESIRQSMLANLGGRRSIILEQSHDIKLHLSVLEDPFVAYKKIVGHYNTIKLRDEYRLLVTGNPQHISMAKSYNNQIKNARSAVDDEVKKQ